MNSKNCKHCIHFIDLSNQEDDYFFWDCKLHLVNEGKEVSQAKSCNKYQLHPHQVLTVRKIDLSSEVPKKYSDDGVDWPY